MTVLALDADRPSQIEPPVPSQIRAQAKKRAVTTSGLLCTASLHNRALPG